MFYLYPLPGHLQLSSLVVCTIGQIKKKVEIPDQVLAEFWHDILFQKSDGNGRKHLAE